ARPGFRPVCFYSPYEAAVHAVLAQRISIAQAARLRVRLIELAGERVEVDGASIGVVPSPRRLLALRAVPRVSAEKLLRPPGVREPAGAGPLAAERLRALEREQALRELSAPRGIGSGSASHVLMRGAGPADTLPDAEPRVAAAAALAYGARGPLSAHQLTELAESWRPFRMWVSVLLVSAYGFAPAARRLTGRRG